MPGNALKPSAGDRINIRHAAATNARADYVLCHLWQAADEMLMPMPHRDPLEVLIGGTQNA